MPLWEGATAVLLERSSDGQTASVASLALADRDRGLRRTVERWTLRVHARPPAPADLLVAAVILRYGKMLAEVSAPRAD